jgi:hypothetical protein
VAHAYNPSYSGGRGQEDHGSKPASGEIICEILFQKNPSQIRVSGVAQGVAPKLKSQHCKKKLNRMTIK